jgi:hypothetical protein
MPTANGINSDDFSREDLITAYRVQRYFDLTGYTGSVGNVTFDARCSLFLGGGGLSANGNSKDNVAVGFQALYGNASGCSNTALGTQALFTNSIGSNNFAQGKCALYSNGYGCNNTAIGYQSLSFNDDGSNNIAVGCQSLVNNRSGCNNVALGHRSQFCNNYGNDNNVSIGQCSAYRLQRTGDSEAGYGYGNNNIAIGCRSLANTCNGSNNIALGNVALCANISGNNNVAIGNSALMRANSYGGYGGNIGIGASAGCLLTTGISNTIIGSLPAAPGCACTVLIGAGACERMRVDNTGLYINGNPVAVDRLTTGSYSVVLGSTGTLTLPQGGTIAETTTTMVLTPPGALAGQSLVIRPTVGTFALSTDHPGGFVPGESITITATDTMGNAGGTLDYEFTGATTQQLGTGTTGTLVIEATSTTTSLTWTIPALSSMTTFTFALTTATGFGGTSGLPIDITVTLDGSAVSENNHIHLLSGDPVTVDLYLGDDNQYVKIEKNGGDVVIATSTNTNHWTFATDGALTLPQGGVINETLGAETLTLVGAGLAAVNQTYINTSPTLYTGSNGVTIEEISPGVWFIVQGLDAKYISTDDLITWSNGTGGLPVPTSTVNTGVNTVNVIVGTETWTFGTDGGLTFPDLTVQSSAYTGMLPPVNGDGTSGNAWMTFYADDAWQSTSKVTINPASGMLTLSGTNGAGGITFPNSGVLDVGLQLGTTSGLTRNIYSEYVGGYALPLPTYGELSSSMATWTADITDIVNPIYWTGISEQTWELTGYFRAPEAGTYTFNVSADDYYFIIIDGDISPVPEINTPAVVVLTQGQIVSYKVLYANIAGSGTLDLQWKNNVSQPTYTSDFGGLVATNTGGTVDLTVNSKAWTFGGDGTTTLPTVLWNYVPTTFSNIEVGYGETQLTFTVQPDGTISDAIVTLGVGGYGPPDGTINLSVPGTTFPGGTGDGTGIGNDITFNFALDSAGATITGTIPTYVSGTPPARYDNISSTGNMGLGSGSSHWTFGTTGTITLPQGSTIGETTTTTVISPPGAVAGQSLVIRPTADPVNTETNHIHLLSGDPVTVDLYLGDDDQYVKIEKNHGNVVIGTNTTTNTNTNHWTFGTTGTITFPDSTVQTTAYTGATSTSTLVNGTSTLSLSSTGTITFPDSTVQTTAWTNTGTTSTFVMSNTTSSTSTATGALVVTGGVGIGGNLYVGGEIVAQKLTIELTTVTTTLIQTDDIIQTTNTTAATSTNTGALTVAGGVGVGGGMFVGGTVTAASITAQASAATTASTAASVGYMGLPQNATGTTTLTMSDAGKHIYVTTAGQTITIPAAASVAYPIGTTITFIAGASATTVLIAITTDTLRLAGGTSTGTRTLAANGMATAVKVSGTSSSGVWYINGTGLT